VRARVKVRIEGVRDRVRVKEEVSEVKKNKPVKEKSR
jgi:hypothetical protein